MTADKPDNIDKFRAATAFGPAEEPARKAATPCAPGDDGSGAFSPAVVVATLRGRVMSENANPIAEAAADYIARGWRPIRIKERSKEPRSPNSFTETFGRK